MQLTINGTHHQLEQTMTIEQILRQLDLSPEHGLAVALNYSVVPRDSFDRIRVQDGDKLEIIHATAGG